MPQPSLACLFWRVTGWVAAILFTLIFPACLSACARSYSICMPSHTSGLLPKALESRMAISGEIPAFSFTRLFRVCRVTPRRSAASVTVTPSGSMHSWRTILPGCGGFFMRMAQSPFCVLMVVDQINIVRVASLEAEDDAPVCPDRHAPEALEVAFEAVQSEAGQVHVFRPPGAVQHEKDVFEFLEQIRADAFSVALLKQPFQPLMPEAFNHGSA